MDEHFSLWAWFAHDWNWIFIILVVWLLAPQARSNGS